MAIPLRQFLFKARITLTRRFSSSPPPTPSSPSRARIDRVLTRLPRFLRPYTDSLRNAPVSNMTAFLILHELTAIVPLVGLAAGFHYTNWLPEGLTEGRYVREGVEKFGRYFGRKGWFGFGTKGTAGLEKGPGQEGQEVAREEGMIEVEERWHVSPASGRILVEVATAYAITKVLLPVRVIASVWATPWFARVVLGRVGGGLGRMFRRGKGAAKAKSAAEAVGKGAKHPP